MAKLIVVILNRHKFNNGANANLTIILILQPIEYKIIYLEHKTV